MVEGPEAQTEADDGGVRAELSFAELLSALAGEMRLLLRQEMALLKAEVLETRTRLERGAFLIAFGALFAAGGFLALLAAALFALEAFLAPPLAALLIGLFTFLLGGVLLFIGKRAFALRSLMPRRTFASLRADDGFLREEPR